MKMVPLCQAVGLTAILLATAGALRASSADCKRDVRRDNTTGKHHDFGCPTTPCDGPGTCESKNYAGGGHGIGWKICACLDAQPPCTPGFKQGSNEPIGTGFGECLETSCPGDCTEIYFETQDPEVDRLTCECP